MKTKIPYSRAMPLAQGLVERLRPFCRRIEICGSLRRECPEVSDIEILYLPIYEERRVDFFSTEPADTAGEELGRWLAAGILSKRLSEIGVATWARLNKLAVHVETGIPVDFFCEPNEADWSRSMVVRTGPKDLSIRLMSGAPKRGLHAHAYGHSVTDQTGKPVPCDSEREFFRLCGEPYAEPRDRK